MERIWAPWRLDYVKNTDKKDTGCPFCLGDESEDRDRYVLERGHNCFAIMNLYPYNNGHMLIVPYKHVNDFCQLQPEELHEIMDMLCRWTGTLKKAMGCQGFNVGLNLGRIAGAGIADHLHFHIVPRWDGDTNFMPAIGNVKIIPQSLDDCYNLLLDKHGACGRNEGE